MTIRRSILFIFTLIALPLFAVAMPTKTTTSMPTATASPSTGASVSATEFLPVVTHRHNRVAFKPTPSPVVITLSHYVAETFTPITAPTSIPTPIETPSAASTPTPTPVQETGDTEPIFLASQGGGQSGGTDNCQAIAWNSYMLEIGNAYLVDVTSVNEKAQNTVHFEKRYQGGEGLTFVRYQFLIVPPKTKKVYVTNAETGSTEDIPYDASAGGVGFESGTGCTIEGLVVQR